MSRYHQSGNQMAAILGSRPPAFAASRDGGGAPGSADGGFHRSGGGGMRRHSFSTPGGYEAAAAQMQMHRMMQVWTTCTSKHLPVRQEDPGLRCLTARRHIQD
eukprot:349593-Chlamydomonas_euryale.AAC.10